VKDSSFFDSLLAVQPMLARLGRAIAAQRSGAVIVEFAIVGPVFFTILFMAFNVAYGAFIQGVLDTAVQSTARQIQEGQTAPVAANGSIPASGASTGAQLQSAYLCPNTLGLLNCGNLYVRIESIDQSAATQCPGGYGAQDLYDATSGALPGSGYALGLALYSNGTGYGTGAGGPQTCESSNELAAAASPGFCIAGGSSATSPVLIILSAVYISPSFLGTLLPNTLTYNGNAVVARFSSAAFLTEGYAQAGAATC
jgi:hypothetical protein